MARGGYRKPTNPAAVSGPGALSARTDGQPTMDLPNAKYGENKAFTEIQQGASMPSAPSPTTPGNGAGLDLSQVVGLGEATTQPETPVTAGAAAGAGPGPEALGLPRDDMQEEARTLAQSGALTRMIQVSNLDTATPAFKRYVRELLANL